MTPLPEERQAGLQSVRRHCTKGHGDSLLNVKKIMEDGIMVNITRTLARKMYNNGEAVMIIPCRVRPTSILAHWTTKPANDPNADFDKLCNAIFYYNCSPETGMKLAFYAKEV